MLVASRSMDWKEGTVESVGTRTKMSMPAACIAVESGVSGAVWCLRQCSRLVAMTSVMVSAGPLVAMLNSACSLPTASRSPVAVAVVVVGEQVLVDMVHPAAKLLVQSGVPHRRPSPSLSRSLRYQLSYTIRPSCIINPTQAIKMRESESATMKSKISQNTHHCRLRSHRAARPAPAPTTPSHTQRPPSATMRAALSWCDSAEVGIA